MQENLFFSIFAQKCTAETMLQIDIILILSDKIYNI